MTCLDLTGLCFAPEVVYDAVVARFAADGLDIPNTFGWTAPSRQSKTDCRVVWVPGDDSSSNIGALGPASRPGNNPRSLGTINELFTVYLDAVDAKDSKSERAQYRQVRGLFNAWWRAVYDAYPNNVSIVSAAYVDDNGHELRRGAAMRVLIEIRSPVPDVTWTSITGLDASIDNTLEGNTETLAVDNP